MLYLELEKHMFLMHRVELKDSRRSGNVRPANTQVPNAPCGVESLYESDVEKEFIPVPNAPCGVERWEKLKKEHEESIVPNAPCGVESHTDTRGLTNSGGFLMHRVELKGVLNACSTAITSRS